MVKNEEDLNIGDLVYFQKSDSDPASSWTMEMISALEENRDDIVRDTKVNCLLRDGCCCKSHCAILHSSGGRSRIY